MAMSRIGLAWTAGIEVLPTCSMRTDGSPEASAIRLFSAEKSSFHAGSCGNRRNSSLLIPYINLALILTPDARPRLHATVYGAFGILAARDARPQLRQAARREII